MIAFVVALWIFFVGVFKIFYFSSPSLIALCVFVVITLIF